MNGRPLLRTLALLLACAEPASALVILPDDWGELRFDEGAVCDVDAFRETSEPQRLLFVSITWDDGFIYSDFALISDADWTAEANTPGNRPMMRRVCDAVLEGIIAAIPAGGTDRRPVVGTTREPGSGVVHTPDLGNGMTCYVMTPAGAAGRPYPWELSLRWNGDATYKGRATFPEITWTAAASLDAKRAMMLYMCETIRADLRRRAGGLR